MENLAEFGAEYMKKYLFVACVLAVFMALWSHEEYENAYDENLYFYATKMSSNELLFEAEMALHLLRENAKSPSEIVYFTERALFYIEMTQRKLAENKDD